MSQKEIYFKASDLKSSEDLPWVIKNNTEFIWIFKNSTSDISTDSALDMLVEKLLKNNRVLNANESDISLLQFDGTFRWNFVHKHHPAKKLILFGIQPSEIGIHYKIDKYMIRDSGEYSFLVLDAPDLLPGLPSDKKALLVQLLKTFHQ